MLTLLKYSGNHPRGGPKAHSHQIINFVVSFMLLTVIHPMEDFSMFNEKPTFL